MILAILLSYRAAHKTRCLIESYCFTCDADKYFWSGAALDLLIEILLLGGIYGWTM